ncbi:acetyl-CoA synthetase-like protein [Auriscalpium vulgare]|uniref:Acetyl-CoA synthetase-like protein n=1 Tax=Auriscalpium vulgare TaxID=40419 RepID=A0ACB8S4Q4_9AGAM|nr:acetyl-CoA synthetase-like protein [Auriscalpium vulgare]
MPDFPLPPRLVDALSVRTTFSTFSSPPLDGSLMIPELLDYNAEHSPDHPCYIFWDGAAIRTVTTAEAARIVTRAAATIHALYSGAQDSYAAQEGVRPANRGPTIGILASADTISYFANVMGIMKLGLVAFPISVRNSAAAVVHLVRTAHIIQLLVSPDVAMQSLAAEVVQLLAKENYKLQIRLIVQFADISDESQGTAVPELVLRPLVLDNVACILHSSGSTAFPKAIPLTNRATVQWAMIPLAGEVDLCGVVIAAHTAPSFHMMGLAPTLMMIATGLILAVFQPSSPPILPTPDRYLKEAVYTKSSYTWSVPSIIEEWSRDPTSVTTLKSFRALIFAGAPMNQTIGDNLTHLGVTILPVYGATEVGALSTFIRKASKLAGSWQYFRLSELAEIELMAQKGEDNIFEPFCIDEPFSKVNVTNITMQDGRNAYQMSDLLQRHPSDDTLYRVYGRIDEQLMLSNGEKTNPVPLEAIMVQDPHVSAALMFGRGRLQNGILVQPKLDIAFDPEDQQKLAEFRNLIWPTVEKLNEYAPAHSRIFKEMILVAKLSKPFEYTVKGQPRRPAILRTYEDEIQALYGAVENSSQIDIEPPKSWDDAETLIFVRSVVQNVLKADITDADDLFQAGCDSLQATAIRNAISHALRKTNQPVVVLSSNVVYANPTISQLQSFIINLLRPTADETDTQGKTERLMRDLVEKYTANFPHRSPNPDARIPSAVDEVVLITGTTGRLGSQLLAQLLRKPNVTRVFAVNRAGKTSTVARQRDAFKTWGLDESILHVPALTFIDTDLAAHNLGLSNEIYAQLCDSVTGIIHNAWRVDFNVSLSSFEPLITGTRNLIDLSLASSYARPVPILFTGSIAVASQGKLNPVVEDALLDPAVAVGAGYGESKWVAETVLLKASEETGMRVNIVRVGQLSGDRTTGAWSEQEWVGAMMRSSQALGCVPEMAEPVAWLPVDVAAASLLDILGSAQPVLHLVHPRPVSWQIVSNAAAQSLHVPAVPFAEWLAKLRTAYETSSADPDTLARIPALKVIDFFTNLRAAPDFRTEKAVRASTNLKEAKRLSSEDVERWLSYWRGTGFISS